MRCELKYVTRSYKNVLVNIKNIPIVIAGIWILRYLDISADTLIISAMVPFIVLYIAGYLRCKENNG